MLLLIFSIYALSTGKFQISRHYGLKGKGARVAGGIFILLFFIGQIMPKIRVSEELTVASYILVIVIQLFLIFLILFVLVKIYGNAFSVIAKDSFEAAERGDLPAFKNFISKGTDISAKNNEGLTALMLASQNAHKEVVQLLTCKENVDIKDNNGLTSLMFASMRGHKEVVQALLDKGADINAKANDGSTALMLASQNAHKEVVQLLTCKENVDIKDNNGLTSLMFASMRGHKEVVQALLDKGADINAKANDGSTALSFAFQKEIKQLLIRAGAKSSE